MSAPHGNDDVRESSKASSKPLISSLNDNDVLLGRGQHIKHDGNSRFRRLVQARVVDYTTCRNKATKDLIAREIVQQVTDSGGRFVRRTVDAGAASRNAPAMWEIADEETVLVKVKQTFRDYSVIARKAAAAAAVSSHQGRAVPGEAAASSERHSQQSSTHDWRSQEPPSSSSHNTAGPIGGGGQPLTSPSWNTSQFASAAASAPTHAAAPMGGASEQSVHLQLLIQRLQQQELQQQQQQQQQQLIALLAQYYQRGGMDASGTSSGLPFSGYIADRTNATSASSSVQNSLPLDEMALHGQQLQEHQRRLLMAHQQVGNTSASLSSTIDFGALTRIHQALQSSSGGLRQDTGNHAGSHHSQAMTTQVPRHLDAAGNAGQLTQGSANLQETSQASRSDRVNLQSQDSESSPGPQASDDISAPSRQGTKKDTPYG